MKILYLIGNGFDLAQNLKTSYQDFYNYLRNQNPINAIESKMLEQITGEEYEKWSDLEFALGQFTKDITSKEEFEEFYFALCDKLKIYLTEQIKGFEANETLINNYTKDLVRPDTYLTPREQLLYAKFFERFSDTRHISLVSFNYTNIINKCLGVVQNVNRRLPDNGKAYILSPVANVHGTLYTSYLLMGVNDEKQIANPLFVKDEDILDYMVKPRSNYEIGTRVDEYVTYSINSANLMVFFGLSFGDTDSIWWHTIGEKIGIDKNIFI